MDYGDRQVSFWYDEDMKHRYIPFTQQPYLCVAACFQMIMYRHNLPLVAQEELAYEMGLTVPEKDVYLFEKARTGAKPSAGWGTQIQKDEYSPSSVFSKFNIPLSFKRIGAADFKNPEGLRELLQNAQAEDADAVLCFDYGKLWDIVPSNGGHVCVFDRIEGDNVHIIDPERSVPKYRTTTITKLFDAMDFHGDNNATGVWLIEKVD